ncbi:hypothetical protein FB451DRAFT_1191818 [Mycena latifolia]|nr:hypothetical protein FB451DRAFT_1191818 [Mycena latifolia]
MAKTFPRMHECYCRSAAPSKTPATVIATSPIPCPIPIPTPSGHVALLVVDGGGDELVGAVVEATILEADPDTEDVEAEAEVNDRKESDVGFVAVAQNCSTSASVEDKRRRSTTGRRATWASLLWRRTARRAPRWRTLRQRGTRWGKRRGSRHRFLRCGRGLKGIEKKGEREGGVAQQGDAEFAAAAAKPRQFATAPISELLEIPLREGGAAELVGIPFALALALCDHAVTLSLPNHDEPLRSLSKDLLQLFHHCLALFSTIWFASKINDEYGSFGATVIVTLLAGGVDIAAVLFAVLLVGLAVRHTGEI